MTKENDAISKIFKKYGAFYAFSQKQFNEQKKEGKKYTHILGGLLCEKGNEEAMIKEIKEENKRAKNQERAERQERAEKLKQAKLPKSERIANRVLLITEAVARIQNYADCDVIQEASEELAQAKEKKDILEAINYVLSCINYRYHDRNDARCVYDENIREIKTLKAEIEAI